MKPRMLKYPAAERNKQPILTELLKYIQPNTLFLEVSSGTGQHISHFAKHLPYVKFQPSEVEDELFGSIRAYIDDSNLDIINEPVHIDARTNPESWANGILTPNSVDYIFNSNMIHITTYDCCEGLFRGCGTILKEHGLLFLYGPFAYDGTITPESNVQFNSSLKYQNPQWGLRDVNKELVPLAAKYHLLLNARHRLPANNDLLVWKKKNNSAEPC